MDLGLQGKKVLVSGATRGIGKACIEEFAKEGAAIALFARDEKLCSEVLSHLKKRYPQNIFVMVIAALGLNDSVKKAVDDAAKALGGLEALL